MKQQGNKLYLFLFVFCLAGYSWFFFAQHEVEVNENVTICPLKLATDLPCPSCGTTRSVAALSSGEFLHSLAINPLGWLSMGFLIIVPVWIGFDLVRRSNSLFLAYGKMESVFKRPTVYIPAIALILVNWIWNIAKGL